jgi:hypothetical protein
MCAEINENPIIRIVMRIALMNWRETNSFEKEYFICNSGAENPAMILVTARIKGNVAARNADSVS